jgi:hypothetical protein
MATEYDHPVKGQGFTTEYAAAILIFGSLLFLIMIRRGFRGVNVGGVGLSIK